MFVLSRDVSAAKKVIATLLATAIVLWASGAFTATRAANVTNVSDLLTDSAPGAVSDHTINFNTPTGIATSETIEVTFPTGAGEFSLAGVTAGDVSIEVNSTNDDADWTPVVGASTITLTQDAGTVAADDQITILIGEVSAAGAGANQITNPTTPAGGNQSYEIDIAGTMTDSGHTRVVILDTVLLTARVATQFDFTVIGNATSTAVNGETTTGASSSTTLPFGDLVALTPEVLSQDLTVQTNAINGFVVTIESDGNLDSSTGADIDEFLDDVISTTPVAWESPSVGLDVGDENTWGHWGITSEDATTTRATEFGSDEWVGVSTTPVVVFSHDGPADEVTPGIGSTTVGFQIEISALQEAADDYSTVLTYIATPTF